MKAAPLNVPASSGVKVGRPLGRLFGGLGPTAKAFGAHMRIVSA